MPDRKVQSSDVGIALETKGLGTTDTEVDRHLRVRDPASNSSEALARESEVKTTTLTFQLQQTSARGLASFPIWGTKNP